jgi:hypothetical protein
MLIDYDLLKQLRYSLKSPLYNNGVKYPEPYCLSIKIPDYQSCLAKNPKFCVLKAYEYRVPNGYLCGEKGTILRLKSLHPPNDLVYEENFDSTYWLNEEEVLCSIGHWPKDKAKIIATWFLRKGDITFEIFFNKLVLAKGDFSLAMETIDIEKTTYIEKLSGFSEIEL